VKLKMDDDVGKIFCNIDEIIGVTQALLEEIENRMKNWKTNPCVGDIFLNLVLFFGFSSFLISLSYLFSKFIGYTCLRMSHPWRFLMQMIVIRVYRIFCKNVRLIVKAGQDFLAASLFPLLMLA